MSYATNVSSAKTILLMHRLDINHEGVYNTKQKNNIVSKSSKNELDTNKLNGLVPETYILLVFIYKPKYF